MSLLPLKVYTRKHLSNNPTVNNRPAETPSAGPIDEEQQLFDLRIKLIKQPKEMTEERLRSNSDVSTTSVDNHSNPFTTTATTVAKPPSASNFNIVNTVLPPTMFNVASSLISYWSKPAGTQQTAHPPAQSDMQAATTTARAVPPADSKVDDTNTHVQEAIQNSKPPANTPSGDAHAPQAVMHFLAHQQQHQQQQHDHRSEDDTSSVTSNPFSDNLEGNTTTRDSFDEHSANNGKNPADKSKKPKLANKMIAAKLATLRNK